MECGCGAVRCSAVRCGAVWHGVVWNFVVRMFSYKDRSMVSLAKQCVWVLGLIQDQKVVHITREGRQDRSWSARGEYLRERLSEATREPPCLRSPCRLVVRSLNVCYRMSFGGPTSLATPCPRRVLA